MSNGFWDNPSEIYWQDHLHTLKRGGMNFYYGKIVDTTGDGGYLANLTQTYSVEIAPWNTVIPNCKISVQSAGHNGNGEYSTLYPNDVVVGIAKDNNLEEFTIIGSTRLNGSHKKFNQEGQGLKPGELVPGSVGMAPANQVSIHPARATKPDSEAHFFGANNIKSEFEDPYYGSDLQVTQDMMPLNGIVQMRNRSGVILNYAWGGIVNYSDGNNVIVSGGTSENKCTKMLKIAKRHSEFANMLSTITGVENKSLTSTPQDELNSDSFRGDIEDTEDTEFGFSNVNLNIDLSVAKDNADVVELLLNAQPSKDNSEDTIVGYGTPEESVAAKSKDLLSLEWDKHPAPPLYRQEQHSKLAAQAIELAQICNTQSAAMHQQAGTMSDAFGNHLGAAGQSSTAQSIDPSQVQGFVHPGNKAVRSTLPGCEGHIQYPEAPTNDLVAVGNGKRLRITAAESFKKMQQAAKGDGVTLTVVSGFRSIAEQKEVFFSKGFKDKNKPTAEEYKTRCRVSAPPGYSEHATGYAADFNSTEFSFEKTVAYKWLQKNAAKFGWKQSFTKDQQLVSAEPWHWKFVSVGS